MELKRGNRGMYIKERNVKFWSGLLEFTIYGVMGWLYEAIATLITCDVFENRGFLHMPVLPIYGFFAFGIIILFNGKKYGIIKTFLMSMTIVTALEYLAGVGIEIVLGKKLWDYSEWFCNIHGRVALFSSILFGGCCVLLLKIMHPMINKFFEKKVNDKVIMVLGLTMLLAYGVDLILTVGEYL